jgi:N-acetylneuraminate lyase
MKNLKGIIPALLTPFTADNRINHPVLRQLVRRNLDQGVSAFYVAGSTAEAFLLTSDERKSILETVVDEVAGRCGVIAHIGAISQDMATELAIHARESGADAISSIPPFYYPFSFDEIKAYYFGIVDRSDMPMIIYNFPAFSGVKLDAGNIAQFLCDKRFIGVKHTSQDYYALNRFKTAFPDKLVFNGYDEMFVSGMAMGADGAIGSTFNFMADKFITMKKLCDEGRYDKARDLQSKVNDLIQVLIKVGVLPGEKEIMNLMGLDFGRCRKPFKPISEEERAMLKNALDALNKS